MIDISKNGAIGVISLSRKEKRNAINQELLEELLKAIRVIEEDDNLKVIIIDSSSGDFSVGADINELLKMNTALAISFREKMSNIVSEMINSDKIFISYLTGFSLGGGFEIAQWSDMIIADEKSRIGQPEVNIGINAGAGGNTILPREVGYKNAMYLALTGNIISAMEAKERGIIQETVRTREEMLEIARKIASKDRETIVAIKKSMRRSLNFNPSEDMKVEEESFIKLTQNTTTKELLKAFLNK